MNKNQLYLIVVVLIVTIAGIAFTSRISAEPGTAVIQAKDGSVSRILHSKEGSISTLWTTGETYHVYNLQTRPHNIEVSATTKEGVAFKIKLFVAFKPLATDDGIRKYFDSFGMSEKPDARILPILTGHLNNATVNEMVKYKAYEVSANLESIQADLTKALKPLLAEDLVMELENLYFIDRPFFDDNKIEAAAATAAAHEKLKSAGISEKEVVSLNTK